MGKLRVNYFDLCSHRVEILEELLASFGLDLSVLLLQVFDGGAQLLDLGLCLSHLLIDDDKLLIALNDNLNVVIEVLLLFLESIDPVFIVSNKSLQFFKFLKVRNIIDLIDLQRQEALNFFKFDIGRFLVDAHILQIFDHAEVGIFHFLLYLVLNISQLNFIEHLLPLQCLNSLGVLG